MSDSIRHHSGSKYIRKIHSCVDQSSIEVDVYSVLEAFGNPPAPVAHAVKKLLCCGIRGKGDNLQDLKEARDAITRMIQMAEKNEVPSTQTCATNSAIVDTIYTAVQPAPALLRLPKRRDTDPFTENGHLFRLRDDKSQDCGKMVCEMCGCTEEQYLNAGKKKCPRLPPNVCPGCLKTGGNKCLVCTIKIEDLDSDEIL